MALPSTRRHRAGTPLDHSIELVLLHQDAAQILMRLRRAEQNAIRHNDSGAPANLKQSQEQREEQKLGLLGLDDAQQILREPAKGGLASTSE